MDNANVVVRNADGRMVWLHTDWTGVHVPRQVQDALRALVCCTNDEEAASVLFTALSGGCLRAAHGYGIGTRPMPNDRYYALVVEPRCGKVWLAEQEADGSLVNRPATRMTWAHFVGPWEPNWSVASWCKWAKLDR